MKNFVLVLVCFIALVSSTYAITCYECAQCKDDYTKYKTNDCNYGVNTCLKVTNKDESIVMRTCGDLTCASKGRMLPGVASNEIQCYECNSNLCNGVGKFTSSSLLIALLPALVALFKIA